MGRAQRGGRNKAHPGVYLFFRQGKLYAKYIDPDTRKMQLRSLDKLGFRTKNEALRHAQELSRSLRTQRQRAEVSGRLEGVGTAWESILAEYKRHFAGNSDAKAAERNDRDWLCRWRDFVSKSRVRTGGDVKAAHLVRFRSDLGSSSLSAVTRNRHLSAVKTMLGWARGAGYVRILLDDIRGHTDHLKSFKKQQRLPKILEMAQLKKLLDAVVLLDGERCQGTRADKAVYYAGKQSPDAPFRFTALAPFTLLALLTGARPGEVLAMKWKDVDVEGMRLKVWGAKTDRERIVPLNDSPALIRLLQVLRTCFGGGIHVIGDGPDGKPRNLRRSSWDRLPEKAELDHAPPGILRRTTVAHVASGSQDSEYLLEARFGHESAVSKTYYRQPLHGVRPRGTTVEEWLGVKDEINKAIDAIAQRGAE